MGRRMENQNFTSYEFVHCKKKQKLSRRDAKAQRTRKVFLRVAFAALRLCVRLFLFDFAAPRAAYGQGLASDPNGVACDSPRATPWESIKRIAPAALMP